MYVVTGASGKLGRLVVEELLARVPASEVVAAVRTPEKVRDLAERGVVVRHADYDRPDTLTEAFRDAGALLLVSGSEVGKRESQHRAVVDAAVAANVGRIAYTSVLHADRTPLFVGPDHRATEEMIRASGLPFTFLRNGWYSENYAGLLEQARRAGTINGCVGGGRIASASRADYAAAAAAVLTGDGHTGAIYELSGDKAWTMYELAGDLAQLVGRSVEYRDLPRQDYQVALEASGLPAEVAAMLAETDAAIAEGWLADAPGTLTTLIDRPTTPLVETLRAFAGEEPSAG